MVILALVGCAGLLATLPEAEPPCMAGTWFVSCPGCDPAWSETVVVRCGLWTREWELALVEEALAGRGGLEGWRAADGPGAGEDLVVTTDE